MQSKIMLQRGSAIVSAEGTQEFVDATVEKWGHLLELGQPPEPPGENGGADSTKATQSTSDSTAKFENVFDVHDGRLKIIQNMPGGSKAEKTRNTALTLLYGEYLSGNETISAEQLKGSCIDQGCYDPSNFASHLKGLKERVVLNPKPGGDYTIKLTAPGRRAAHELVTELNSRDT